MRLLAGEGTTAATLAWGTYFIAMRERLSAEAKAVLGAEHIVATIEDLTHAVSRCGVLCGDAAQTACAVATDHDAIAILAKTYLFSSCVSNSRPSGPRDERFRIRGWTGSMPWPEPRDDRDEIAFSAVVRLGGPRLRSYENRQVRACE